MSLNTNLTLLIIGTGIGLGIALIGGVAEYWLSLRSDTADEPRKLPGCLIFVIGFLTLAGIVSTVASFLINGAIGPALILGAGVLQAVKRCPDPTLDNLCQNA
jgi:hypothetical protein